MAVPPLYSFGPFELDMRQRKLLRAGEPLPLTRRNLDVLEYLLANAGAVVSKDAIISAAWADVAVSDNSVEQAVSALRRVLGDDPSGHPYLENVPRHGYRFAAPVRRTAMRQTDEVIEALLAPHRAFVEGRAALETLELDRIAVARAAFETVLTTLPAQASAHVGLANACIMQFEATRADPAPDRAALAEAIDHAREACRLDIEYAEAWATLGFVLDRAGQRTDALAASRRAVMLDAGNWRHHFRLALVSWGEERLSAAHQTLVLVPGFPLAHYTAATVYVARQAIGEAERELASGLRSADQSRSGPVRFASVALHWLSGLILLSRGKSRAALEAFERELASEASGQLYARECAANTWYAIAALHWREGRTGPAADACRQVLERVATHPMAAALGSHLASGGPSAEASDAAAEIRPEVVFARACAFALAGDHPLAAALVDRMLVEAPAGSAGWLLPLEPVLAVHRDGSAWSAALARLRARAT